MSRQRQSKSAAWRRRQEADAHVRAARAAGYRSRAAYKLLAIDEAHGLLRRGMAVVDLGAAPGGWSQVVRKKIGAQGRLVAVDRLATAPLEGVHVVHGDFTAAAVRRQMEEILGAAADLVLSDMAPNLSGIAVRDQANMQELFEAALAYCGGALKEGGDFLIKTFAGELHGGCRAAMQPLFDSVQAVTPDATRKGSRECYLLGRGFKPAAR